MSRKATDPVKREERARKYREAVAPHLGGEFVEAVGAFERFDEDLGVVGGGIGSLIRAATTTSREKKRRKREGAHFDLPEYFLLAVTEDRVHAFSLRRSMKVGDHVADFPRRDVSISPGDDWAIRGVIELTGEGRKGRIDVNHDQLNEKTNPWAAEVVAALEAAGLSE
jgi:hypothetical protein